MSIATRSKPALTRRRIFSAALAQIDRRGVAAFNLRELASALGVYPTAIYWHVPNRDELIAGAVALALRRVGSGAFEGRWQDRLRALLIRFRDALRRHPNLAPVIGHELISNGPLDLPMLELIVQALEQAGFDGPALVDAFNVVIAALCGFVTLELAALPESDPQGWAHTHRERVHSIGRDAHPALARHLDRLGNHAFILRWSSGTTKPMHSGFEAWIDVVISGLEARSAALRSRKIPA